MTTEDRKAIEDAYAAAVGPAWLSYRLSLSIAGPTQQQDAYARFQQVEDKAWREYRAALGLPPPGA